MSRPMAMGHGRSWSYSRVAVFMLGVVMTGCAGEPSTAPRTENPCVLPGAPECAITPSATELVRMSDCFQMTHTIDTSPALFHPTYPPGTRPVQDGVTVSSLKSFLCRQGTTANATFAPFHFAYFASVIDPPGTSAEGSTGTLALHQFLTNSADLGRSAETFGLNVTVVKDFSFAQDPAPGEYVSPYVLRIPGDRPIYTFEGTSNAGDGGLVDHATEYLYFQDQHGKLAILKNSFDRRLANPSQPATASFSPESYWAQNSDVSMHPSVNAQGKDASGNLTIEFLEKL